MSTNLYCREIVEYPERNYYELKFLMRRLFDTDRVDVELDESDLPILNAALVTTEDPEIAASLGEIVMLLEQGKRLHLEEKS